MGKNTNIVKNTSAVLAFFVLAFVFIGCASSTDSTTEIETDSMRNEATATIESMTKDNILNTKSEKREEPEFAPGKGLPEMPSTLEVHVMNLPGTPVLIKDQFFATLFGASDTQNASKVSAYISEQEVKGLKYFLIPSTNPTTFSGAMQVLVEHRPFYIGELRAGDPSGYMAKLRDFARENGMVFERQAAGKVWYDNGTRFEVLFPQSGDVSASSDDISMVLEVQKNEVSFLITGEIDTHIEKTLIERGKLVEVDYLIATNGAVEGSMSDEFLDALSPEVVIVGVSDSEPVEMNIETIEIVGTDTLKVITNGTEHRIITKKKE